MINFVGTPSLFFILNPAFIHHPLLVILDGKNINLDLLHHKNIYLHFTYVFSLANCSTKN
jgi:hypothetical protein